MVDGTQQVVTAGGGVIYAIFVAGIAVGALIVLGIQKLMRKAEDGPPATPPAEE